MSSRQISLLSLARRAGKLVLGFDRVADALREGKSKGVFCTADLSEKSRKELAFTAQKYGMQPVVLAVTMDQVQHACGKRSGVIALCDEGFSKKLSELAQMPEKPVL